jgi:curved DNA-binding protein
VAGTDYKDYYQILGITKSAGADEIKKAYRQQARKYHPDVNPNDKAAEEQFKAVSEAYEVLSDAEKRQKYDQFGQYWKQAGGGAGGRSGPTGGGFEDVEFGQYANFDDFINELLGRMGGGARPQGRSAADPFRSASRSASRSTAGPNLDQEATLRLTLGEAFNGVEKRLSVGGDTLTVKIPPGAKTGSRIRVRGKGQFSPHYTSERGDLYLNVELSPHSFFQFDGDNLTCEVAIAPDEAVLGAAIDVPTPDGPVTVNVPAGIRSGQSLRLRGKGWKTLKGERSDQMVKIIITAPKAISDAERAAYETVRDCRSVDPRLSLKGVRL